MSELNNYIDFHCHPAMKPFGRSFRSEPAGIQSRHRSHKTSLWRYDPPSWTDKILNYLGGLTKFSQSNGHSLTRGGVGVISASLYPLEKGFVNNAIDSDTLNDLLLNFATGLGDDRIDFLQEMTDYFKDLELEYTFYKQCHGHRVRLPEGRYQYKLVRSYDEIEEIRLSEESSGDIKTLCIVMSIEGLHVLNTGLDRQPDPLEVLENLAKIKAWEFPPFFITVAHHFWNHICGHAPSLSGIVKKYADQTEGMGRGMTALGRQVLAEMLSADNGPRILPDLKHMSGRAREEFYTLRETSALGVSDFPLLISHGACNGLKSFSDPNPGPLPTARLMNPVEINFYDSEIIALARSGGLIGLQLDERRIASKTALGDVPHSVLRHKIMHYRSELLWRQVQHIAETLDQAGLFAWDCMAIGSDFDGIIDSLNGFWTAEELPFLSDFLERHAYNYLKTARWRLPENRIDADQVVERIFSGNGHRFLKAHFRAPEFTDIT
jgi:hypothetical protein